MQFDAEKFDFGLHKLWRYDSRETPERTYSLARAFGLAHTPQQQRQNNKYPTSVMKWPVHFYTSWRYSWHSRHI